MTTKTFCRVKIKTELATSSSDVFGMERKRHSRVPIWASTATCTPEIWTNAKLWYQ